MTITFQYTGGQDHDIIIEWFHDGVLIEDGGGVTGATTTSITVPDTEEYEGFYYAVVTDLTVDCSVQTVAVHVEVPGLCTLAITLEPIAVETSEGNTVQLTTAYAGAVGAVTIQWYRNDVALVDGASGGATISGATTTTLTITDSEAALSGSYYAVVTDAGVAECTAQTATVLVTINPSCGLLIDEQPENQMVSAGAEVELTFTFTGGIGPFTYQWYLDGTPLINGTSGLSTISGATTDTLTITNWQSALEGSYTAAVTDTGVADCSAQTEVALIELLGPPPNSYIWYKADAESFGDGDTAFPLQDWSGNNLDLTISGNPPPFIWPIFETGELNGLPVFFWPGPLGSGNDANSLDTVPFSLVDMGFPVTSTGLTMAIVINRQTLNPNFNDIPILGFNHHPFGFPIARVDSELSGSTNTYTFAPTTASSVSLTVALNTWQIVTGTFDFSEGIPRIRTNDLTATGGVTDPEVIVFNQCTLAMAAEGAVAEVLLYNTKLSDDDLAQLRTYLSEKWGIPITV